MSVNFKFNLFLFFTLIITAESKYGYMTWIGHKEVVIVTDNELPDLYLAKATYSNEINTTGWAFFELHTSADASDEQQAYAAGYLEGYLTWELIWMHWENTLQGYCSFRNRDVCRLIEDYLDKNEAYIKSMVEQFPNDPYWYQIKLYYKQLEGLAYGYNEAAESSDNQLSVRTFLWINMMGDLDELALALSMPPTTPAALVFPEHCSGLVKLLPDGSDLYTAQATWNSYQSMLRLQKKYVMHFKMAPNSSKYIPGYKMSLSSYPGFVQSADDFYILSSGLVAAETTIGNNNQSLFRRVRPKGQILEFVRVMVANRLAESGAEWVDIFRKHNSGTYNNQWYIVDYKKFKPRTAKSAGVVKAGLLWVVEQLPGYTEAADITDELKKSTYFPSYNIAYFPRVFNLSGGNERVAALGDWFGYHTNPRAKIFKQKQGDIKNLRDMYDTMRYNDYLHDPLSRCDRCDPPYSACNAVAARDDLNPPNGTYPFYALGHRSHGATDVKITSSWMRPTYGFLAVSGPTYNVSRGIPPFQWSKFDLGVNISHTGHPDEWTFAPVLHHWEWA